MSITYRQHQDTRDGKIYPCVLMPDGKWWSAVNLAHQSATCRVPVGGNQDAAIQASRQYQWADAVASTPPGAHIPTDAEWTAMVSATSTGTSAAAIKSNPVGWHAAYRNGTDIYGLGLIAAGYITGDGAIGGSPGSAAFYWTSPTQTTPNHYPRAIIGNGGVTSSTDDNGYSAVRFIVDTFNEPIPPTKIKGTFSGSGVKVFCTNYNTPTFELPLSAQTTTELTIKKDFIATWGAALGNVRILVVDGEYISDWKDWNFNA